MWRCECGVFNHLLISMWLNKPFTEFMEFSDCVCNFTMTPTVSLFQFVFCMFDVFGNDVTGFNYGEMFVD